jgi:tetratricopeptide (TPR) repeat protein
MAVHGKAREWQKAVRVADAYLARADDANIRFLRGEALFRVGAEQGGIEMAKVIRGGDDRAEAELLRGDTRAFGRTARDALRRADERNVSALDANNTAWLAAFTPSVSDPELLAKAVALSEKAVRYARLGEDEQVSADLATYTNTLGGVYHRAGRDADAIATLLESEKLRSDPFNAAFLTLAYRRTGNRKAEKAWRDRLEKHLSNTYATRDGQMYRHQLLLLWREIGRGTQE